MVAEKVSRSTDFGITLLAVPALVFLVGHVTALFPETGATGPASAAAFTCLILAYATLIGPGRRSGAPAFSLGAIAVVPIWWTWFGWTVTLGDDNWYISTFRGFRLGLSDRGFGHSGEIWLFLWTGSILLMIGVALLARRALFGGQRRPWDSEVSNPASSTTLKGGLITFGATYVLLTTAGNLATLLLPPYLWIWEPNRVASLVLFAALVGLYALGTGPGRRTGWRVYLLIGVLLPVFLWLVAIIGYVLPLSYQAYEVSELLTAGFGVGFRVAGGGYPPFEVTVLLWMLGIVLATVAAPIIRDVIRKPAAC